MMVQLEAPGVCVRWFFLFVCFIIGLKVIARGGGGDRGQPFNLCVQLGVVKPVRGGWETSWALGNRLVRGAELCWFLGSGAAPAEMFIAGFSSQAGGER